MRSPKPPSTSPDHTPLGLTARHDHGSEPTLPGIPTLPQDSGSTKSSGAFPLIDRRLGLDRRHIPAAGSPSGEPTQDTPADQTGLERRRGAGRRRTDFMKAADEGELTSEQFLFLMAIDAFKKSNNKMYPTWSDILEVIRLLGYRKTMPSELNLRSGEDWQEPANTPAKVKTIEGKRHAA